MKLHWATIGLAILFLAIRNHYKANARVTNTATTAQKIVGVAGVVAVVGVSMYAYVRLMAKRNTGQEKTA